MDEDKLDTDRQEGTARNQPGKSQLKTNTDTGEGGAKPEDVSGTNLEELRKQREEMQRQRRQDRR